MIVSEKQDGYINIQPGKNKEWKMGTLNVLPLNRTTAQNPERWLQEYNIDITALQELDKYDRAYWKGSTVTFIIVVKKESTNLDEVS